MVCDRGLVHAAGRLVVSIGQVLTRLRLSGGLIVVALHSTLHCDH